MEFVENAVETVLARLPIHDNYFWRLYFFGQYSKACCPEYLKEKNFLRLRGGLVDRISIHTDSVAGFLEKHRTPISRFVFLDHMDWLNLRRPDILAAEWQGVVNLSTSDARYLWRSAGQRVDFVDPITVRRDDRTWQMRDLLRYDMEKSTECHARDRVHTYGSFYIASFAS